MIFECFLVKCSYNIYLLMYKLNHEYICTYVASYLFTNLYNYQGGTVLITMVSHAKSCFSLICACVPSPFASVVFVVNHHLQLEVLTLRLCVVF